jgi:hypothetical protein
LYLITILININNFCFADFATPLTPAVEEKNHFFGILLGFGQNMQSGISKVNCDDCQFENGIAFGYTFGFTYEKQVGRDEESF